MLTALVVVIVIVKVAAELFVTMFLPDVTGTVAAFPEAAIAFAVRIVWEKVCVPVKV